MPLPILYQDNDLVVVNKRSGLLVHRSAIDSRATEFAMQKVRDQIGRLVYPVHRLDRATSGALMFALSADSARVMTEQFSGGLVEKKYLAVVRGFCPAQALVEHPLREELDRIADAMARKDKPAQPAVTHLRCMASCELPYYVDKFPTARYSLVEAIPKTGRKHQIRRHLRHIGHPIVGDVTHGVGKHNRFFQDHFGIRRLLLACVELSFVHPISNQLQIVKAPIADDFRALMEKLGWGASV